ncbi:MAG: XRE family transcriptional regulator, partial [Thermomicrobiales bacterium]
MSRRKFSEVSEPYLRDPGYRSEVENVRRMIRVISGLSETREHKRLTQQDVADRLGVSQANVSRIEHEDDLYLSTLRDYVEALGGELQLKAV